ncbi:DUF7287 family protein [Halosimplex halophilum]|uniref:DUF7287 family protein n=1 Tax=Halosimplex halophilum TaxID=2559572 RepID=UPI001FEAA5DC|nr:hypothetical protein [Halosimplex halophilum]
MSAFGDSTGSATRAGDARRIGSDERRDRRGQTTLDFAIGTSLFLLTLVFVVAFVPGMLEPFAGGAQSETPAVNRVADGLTQGTLGNASAPYVLDETCTVELFTAGVPAQCRYDGATLSDRVGVLQRTPVNVTIRGDLDGSGTDSILCWDTSVPGGQLAERGESGCGPLLTGGSNPAGSGGKTVSARRVALLDGEDVTVEVVMW